MATFVDQMAALATAINDLPGDVFATTDPERAANNRPCLLVVPPVLDYAAGTFPGGPVVRHRVFALSSRPVFDADALDEFVPLIDAATEALPTIETASPGVYPLAVDKTAPCYLLTLTR